MMADIHILPTRSLSGSSLERLTEQLRHAHEAGAELGSRALHIRAMAPICRNKAQKLRGAAQEMHPTNPGHRLFDAEAEQQLLKLADEIERLADLAANFPHDSR